MSASFQPATANPADIVILQSLLRRCPTADLVGAEIARGFATAFDSAIGAMPDAAALDATSLALRLMESLLQVQDADGWREARIIDWRLRVPINAQGQAIGYWQTGSGGWGPERQLQEPLRNADWVVTLTPRLRRVIEVWLHEQPWFDDLWPVERHELPRALARAAQQALEDEAPRLKGLLLLRLGYPRDFLHGYLRELGRGTPHPTPGEIAQLLGEWETLRRWPARARKLVWLALPLQEGGHLTSLHIEEVRNALRALGLSRNAWARLHRVPLPQIRDLGLMLAHWQRQGHAGDFLQALGFLFSRLGGSTGFYRAWRVHLPEVLSDISSRIAAVRLGQRVPVSSERQQWYRLQRRAASLRVLNAVVPGAVQAPEQIAKTELLLVAVARYLLQPAGPRVFANRQDDLVELVDWFRGRSEHLPVAAFKGELPVLLRQARQWHQRLYEDRERRQQHEALLRAQQQEALRRSNAWRVPLRAHSGRGFEFLVLDRQSELIEEGLEMQHCVGSYAQSCKMGDCHIVSIRSGGERLATLELRESEIREWERVQLKGRRNAMVGADVEQQGARLHDGIRDFLKAFNAAWRKER